MEELICFIKEKRQLLFFLLFFEGMLWLIYALYGLPAGPTAYTCLLTGAVALGLLGWSFFNGKGNADSFWR